MLHNTTYILKNTLYLFFRQILIIFIGLYTVRVRLDLLGMENYGIYNVVAGVVIMFTFLRSSMSSATQRFLNYAIGENNIEQVRNIFSVSIIINLFLALLIIFLSETIGLIFFYKILKIPQERQSAALIVYQITILSTIVNIFIIPYTSTIISNEKMSFFALISIIEATLKLSIIYILSIINFDKLIIYSILILLTDLIILFCQIIYCNFKFKYIYFSFCKDRQLYKKLSLFSVWSVLGGFAQLSNSQGLNIMMNYFHGVLINAAMGIATQVNTTVNTFVTNFQTAFHPSIIKSYAIKDHNYYMKLIFQTSKISFFLSFLFVLPLYINMEFVLFIWLNNIPEYSVIFTRLLLLNSLEISLTNPFLMAVQATGNIKKYQILTSSFIFANLPLSFIFLFLGFVPYFVLIIRIILGITSFIFRVYYLNKNINLPVIIFIKEVIIPLIIMTIIASFFSFSISKLFENWNKLLITCLISSFSIIFLFYFIVFTQQEKLSINKWIKSKLLFKI